ncbi:MAG: hypothetical protein GYB67_08775 [Chloroflexi bacterium]|nr:hypothetical protein [Chloroflexota bacterium]
MNKRSPFLNVFSVRWNFSVGLVVLLVLVTLGTAAEPVHSQAALDLDRIQRATVFVMQARSVDDDLIITCIGSGTLVSRDGLLLTNAHNTVPNANCPGDVLIIGLTVFPGEPPIPRFRAEVIQADPGLDLALLRITRQVDGRLLPVGSLGLPFVELGNSDEVPLDETLTIAGYPGIGDDPVTLVTETVRGFTAEPSGGSKSWIKTGGSILGTMSGGGAYDQAGRLIGIPTTAPITRASPEAACLPLQDTNSDGLIDTTDSCVPIGGVINVLRPSNFARPLLRAATLGLDLAIVTPTRAPARAAAPPSFSRLFFASSERDGMPLDVVQRMPTGTTSVYLFFDYDNMTPETVYELRVTVDGIPRDVFGLSPVRWSGGTSGLWHIGGSADQPVWPNGTYIFTLFIDGISAAAPIVLLIGGGQDPSPQFSDILFGNNIDANGNLTGNGLVVGTGGIVYAKFLARSMTNGLRWTAVWYFQGAEVFRTPPETVWTDGVAETKVISVENPGGLLPGVYRLELYIEDRLSATSDFTVAGAQLSSATRIFSDLHFTTAASDAEARTAPPISSYSSGVETIYAVFDWEQIAPGTPWTMRWTVDGESFYQQTMPWGAAESGENFLVRLTSPGGISDGTYTVELLMAGRRFDAIVAAPIGIGQLPIDRFAEAGGIPLSGQILDAQSRSGIAGVTFVLVSEDFNASEFTEQWDQEQVYALAVTDRSGRFQLDRPLQPGAPYSVVIIAEGYLPIAADGIVVAADDDPVELEVYLTRG